MSNHKHLSRNRQKKKKELFLIILQLLFFNLLNGICFPLYAWSKILYRYNVPYMILIQPKKYTSCHVCNKLNNGKFIFQNLICVYFLFEIRILRHKYLDKLRVFL